MEYVRRLADARLAELVQAFPAVLVNGPRAVGKTTTARRLATEVVRLSEPAQAAPFIADPDAALRLHREPLLLDEWQEVPDLLRAVKSSVDQDPRPGRFILTGSVRSELERKTWPGTGRVIRLNMYGLTEAEISGRGGSHTPFLDRLQQADPAVFTYAGVRPDLPAYLNLVLRGGFPEVALRTLTADLRDTWIDSYLDQLLSRDLQLLTSPSGRKRDPLKLRDYFNALSVNTAGLPNEATLINQARISRPTALAYDRLLQHLFVSEQVPGWTRKRSARLVQAKKRYIVDPALAASAIGLTAQAILGDPELIGRMIDTFVAAQIRPEIALTGSRIRAHHLRTKEGRQEIDLVIEMPGGALLALEIKAAAAVSKSDAKHLIWLRDLVGSQFVAGAVLHTGPVAFRLDERILALPISAIWEA